MRHRSSHSSRNSPLQQLLPPLAFALFTLCGVAALGVQLPARLNGTGAAEHFATHTVEPTAAAGAERAAPPARVQAALAPAIDMSARPASKSPVGGTGVVLVQTSY